MVGGLLPVPSTLAEASLVPGCGQDDMAEADIEGHGF